MSEAATTHGIRIEVETAYEPEESDPSRSQFFFRYTISITNTTKERVQLLSRHWIITDGLGRVEEVKGDGVIGVQPWIEPGSWFQYGSFCPLTTATGSMRGFYEMVSGEGPAARTFSVEIPQFFLVEPGSFH